MRSKNNLRIHLTVVLIFSFCTCFSQSKNFSTLRTEPTWLQKIVTSEKRPANRDIQDGYYLFLFEQQNNLETQEQYQHAIREIVSDNGVQNASEISVTYDPSYQKLTFHKVIVWRDNKPIDKLSAGKFKVMQNEKELSKFIYSGTYDAYLILDDVRKGDRIEYAYTLKGENPVFANKYSNTYYFDGDSQTSNIYINLIAKKERAIQFKNFNDVPSIKIKEQNGFKIYEWQNKLTKTVKSYDYEPSWYDAYSRVQVSEFKSWKEIVDWSLQLNTYELSKSPTLSLKIKELQQKSKKNNESYLTLATRFVQDEVRYMGIEMGEYSHRPNSPEKVLKQRYGDCKDKSLLLINILRGNGITAFPVYINTYLKDKTKDLLPTTGAFNHVIVLVEFEGQKIWIDPTMSEQGGSIKKNYFPYAANVLVIKPGNDKLEWVQPSPTGKLSSLTLIKMPNAITRNKAEINIKSSYSANYADDMRSEISSSGVDKLEKDFLEYYTKIYPDIAKIKDLIIIDDKKNNIISLEENYEVENIWTKEDSTSTKYYADFYGDMINNEVRKLDKARNVPFALKSPSNVHQIVKIFLPMGSDIKPKEIHIDRAGYRFDYNRTNINDTLVLDYSYENKSYEIPAAATRQYVKDNATMDRAINYRISFDNSDNDDTLFNDINFSMVILMIFAFISSGIGAIFIYHHRTNYDLEKIKGARKIGGWLIVVAIGVIISPFSIGNLIYKSDIYRQSTWDNLSTYGSNEVFWKWLVSFEAFSNTVLFVFCFLIIALFFNRRKELPKYYIILRIVSIITAIISTVFAHFINTNLDKGVNLVTDIAFVVSRLIFSVVWIIYFMRSTRVKETFVFTYPKSAWRFAYIQEISAQINVPFPADLDHDRQDKLSAQIQEESTNNDEPKL